MNESAFTSKLLRELRHRLPEAVVLKHNDSMTAGIPDFSITLQGTTNWWEVKLTTHKHPFTPLQLAMLRKLRGKYIIWDQAKKAGVIVVGPPVQVPTEFSRWMTFPILVSEIIEELYK